MLSKIQYIAAYQVAPVSAITHVAEVERIEKYKDTGKYILYFKVELSKLTKSLCRALQKAKHRKLLVIPLMQNYWKQLLLMICGNSK